MTKKYTLTTSEETVTENPEDIIRLMKLAGLKDAQPVAEEEVTEEVEAEVYEPTEANDELDLDDYSKKSPESINKQKKSIQPTLGDNPLEYSLDENEIYEAMMKEFKETEEVSEAQSPAQKAAFAKMLAAKDGKKEETEESVEETEETEKTVEENLEKAQEQINELKEDCSCGHGSDCDCGPDCDCGCNSVNEEEVDEDQERLKKLSGIKERPMNFSGTRPGKPNRYSGHPSAGVNPKSVAKARSSAPRKWNNVHVAF